MNLQLVFIALVCGVCQAFQAATNGTAARNGLGVFWTGTFSATVSALLLATGALIVLRTPFPSAELLAAQGYKAALGGALGAMIVGGLTFAAPRLGATQTFILYFAAIVAASLAIDALGLVGMEARALRPKEILGLVLAAAGVLLARS